MATFRFPDAAPVVDEGHEIGVELARVLDGVRAIDAALRERRLSHLGERRVADLVRQAGGQLEAVLVMVGGK